MGEFFIWIGGVAGLVTLGRFLLQLMLRRRTGDNSLKYAANWARVWNLKIDFNEGTLPQYRRWRWKYLGYQTSKDDITYVNPVRKVRLPMPPTYREICRYLPTEFQEFKEEIIQYLEDGVGDRAPEKRKGFLRSESFSLVLFIGKFQLFKLKKSWRRTIK